MSENNDSITININVEGNGTDIQERYNFPWPGDWSPIPICFPYPHPIEFDSNGGSFMPNGDFFTPGRIHNLLLKELMNSLPSVDLDIKEVQAIFIEKLINLNGELALGYDNDTLKQTNFIPSGKLNYYDNINLMFEKSEAGKDSYFYEAIENLKEIGKQNKDNLLVMANAAIEIHGKFISKVKNPKTFTDAMSIAHASASLYANLDNAGKLLGVSGNSKVLGKIDWWKVATCDAIGGTFGGHAGAAVASGCSIVMQS